MRGQETELLTGLVKELYRFFYFILLLGGKIGCDSTEKWERTKAMRLGLYLSLGRLHDTT